MLTTDGTAVDDHAGLFVSVTRLAALKGVTKQAISRRLDRLISEGLIAVRRRGKEKLVNLAQWDTVTDDVTDPAKLAGRDTQAILQGRAPSLEDDVAARLGPGQAKADPTYTEQLTRKAGYEADLKQIEIDRKRGLLLEIEDVRRAMERCAEAILRELEQFPAGAEDIAAAVSRSGVAGARDMMKAKVRELRERLAATMTLLGAPEDEDESEDEAA